MFLVLGNAGIDEAMAIDTWPAPGQTIVVGAPRRDLGGKGVNQAVVLSRTGAPTRFVAAIGRDAEGDWVAAQVAAAGLSPDGLRRVDAATDRSLIFVNAAGENAIASTVDAARSIDPDLARALVAELGSGDGLLMQGNLTFPATEAALIEARRRGVLTVVNPSPMQDGFAALLPWVDLLIVNEGEAAMLGGDAQALLAAGAGAIALTLGRRGAVLVNAEGVEHAPGLVVPVVDTTGAGDTFAGVLVGALHHRRLPARAALAAANAAAALSVGRVGTMSAFPSREEIDGIFGG